MQSWLSNLSVKRKLGLGFAIVLLLTLAIAITGGISSNSILHRSGNLVNADQMRLAYAELRENRQLYLVEPTAENFALLSEEMQAFLDSGKQLAERLKDPADIRLAQEQQQFARQLSDTYPRLKELAETRQQLWIDLIQSMSKTDQGLQAISSSVKNAGRALEPSVSQYLYSLLLDNSLQAQSSRSAVNQFYRSQAGDQAAYQNAQKQLEQSKAELQELGQALPSHLQNALPPTLEANANTAALLTRFNQTRNDLAALQQNMDALGKSAGQVTSDLHASQIAKKESESAFYRNLMLASTLLALALGALAAWAITRQIVRPLNETLKAAERVANGDLSQDISSDRRDELGQLQRSMQTMTASLRELIGSTRDSVIQIASAAQQLSAVTEQTNAGVNQQKDETDQVATAINEMTATVQDVARSAEQASHAADDADNQARGGEKAVADALKQMSHLAQEVEHSNQAVSQLRHESEQIASVLDVIKAVADQTNLLALNAAIEAARAGEAGRGFAVVADEVRGLAKRTQKSTQEIESLISNLQGVSQQAAQRMDSSRALTESTLELTRSAGERLLDITTAVSAIQSMNQQIAAAAEQQSAVADEINRSVVKVRDISEQTASASEETAANSTELARLGGDLHQQISRFSL